MKQEFNNNDVCPCCGRHCSADDLHCPRGQAHFGQDVQETEHTKHMGRHGGNIKDETVMLMLKCGHLLHHGLRERAENEDILQFLSQDEKKELTAILQKCLKEWDN